MIIQDFQPKIITLKRPEAAMSSNNENTTARTLASADTLSISNTRSAKHKAKPSIMLIKPQIFVPPTFGLSAVATAAVANDLFKSTPRSIEAQQASDNKTPAGEAPQGSFKSDTNKYGFYKTLKGKYDAKPVNLKMSRKAELIDVGGFYIEGDSIYSVKGDFAGIGVDLKIKHEDIISDIGGMKVQTGSIEHVAGQVGDRKINADVTYESEITNIGGMQVETDRWANFKSKDSQYPDMKITSVSVVEDAGGLQVETDRYNKARGKDASGPVDVTLRGYGKTRKMTMQGECSKETAAMLTALKPFLAV